VRAFSNCKRNNLPNCVTPIFKKTVGYVYAVDGVNLTVQKGKTHALVGESGCRKTTLGQAILQLGSGDG
jgi:peptide/nickel transport system ATP-binding protein